MFVCSTISKSLANGCSFDYGLTFDYPDNGEDEMGEEESKVKMKNMDEGLYKVPDMDYTNGAGTGTTFVLSSVLVLLGLLLHWTIGRTLVI